MFRLLMAAVIPGLLISVAVSPGLAQQSAQLEPTPLELFDQRILPIFRSPDPSSCVQCHLAAVDLKNYILPSHQQTFASLRDQGLIDVLEPDKSKILTLIRMGDKDLDKGARLIHENTRRAEYEAFAAWIKACCNDPTIRDLPPLSAADRAAPEKPDAVIRHARKSRVVDSFARNIWSQRMRCFPCHTPYEIDASNPRHQAAVKTRREFERKYGSQFLQRLNIFRETPEATLEYLVDRSRQTANGELPLINLAEPRKSLLLLKPLSKLPAKNLDGHFATPSSVEPVSHMGGLKMHPDDQSYKSFVAWIQDYANVVGDRYVSVEDLPADNWHATQQVLRLSNTPQSWPVGIPVQLFVYGWSDETKSWTPRPIAFTQGTVTPKKIVNGALFLLAQSDSGEANPLDRETPSLTGGRYLVKTYVDLSHRLADDPSSLLGDEDFRGQVEFKKSRWREGFRSAASVSAANLVRE